MDSVEHARITVVIDNHVDMLLPDREDVKRFGMLQHMIPPNGVPIHSENGISYWIELQGNGSSRHLLFDTGLSGSVLLHNFRALGLSAEQLNHCAISHGHLDHYGGLFPLLAERERALPVAIHPDAFLPKHAIDDRGEKFFKVNGGLERKRIERANGIVVEARDAVELGPGTLATGEIPRDPTPFEPPVPIRPEGPAGVFIERDGELIDDDATIDDQAVVLNVEGKGLVVLTACGHSGMINTIRHAQKLTGVDQVHAVIGGFHTGFPGVRAETADKTIEELREIGPEIIAPMHCSGIRMISLVLEEFPDQFLHNTTGSTLIL